MARFESIVAWKAYETAHLEKVEHGLYTIRDEVYFGADPVVAFVLGGNRAINDSVNDTFVHYLGRIAYNTGLLDGVRERAYGQEEVSMNVLGLSQLGEINVDPHNLAKYYHPTFVPRFGRQY